jgi:hypothetical protein
VSAPEQRTETRVPVDGRPVCEQLVYARTQALGRGDGERALGVLRQHLQTH